jgi:hypothetical protein
MCKNFTHWIFKMALYHEVDGLRSNQKEDQGKEGSGTQSGISGRER